MCILYFFTLETFIANITLLRKKMILKIQWLPSQYHFFLLETSIANIILLRKKVILKIQWLPSQYHFFSLETCIPYIILLRKYSDMKTVTATIAILLCDDLDVISNFYNFYQSVHVSNDSRGPNIQPGSYSSII